MTTTSTRPPAVLRSDIKRVLDRMQVQYRETKGGYECIHVPSIDINSITETQAQRYHHQHQRSHAPEGTTRRSLVHKASKLTFTGNKGKEKEHDGVAAPEKDKEREAPGRPSATASSGSSSFFNVPTATAGTASPTVPEQPLSTTGIDPSPAFGQAEGSSPVPDDVRPRSPTKAKFLPPIPRDFAAPPLTTESSRPTFGEADKDPFNPSNQGSLSVRFEINIIKVLVLLLPRLTVLTSLRRCLGSHYMVYNFDEWAGMAGSIKCLLDVS